MTDGKLPLTVEFMLRLRKIDKSRLTVRDVLLLYTIISNPGINGWDAGRKIGLNDRSSVTFALARMIRRGLIEDRREPGLVGKGVPNQLHALPAGIEFWSEIRLQE